MSGAENQSAEIKSDANIEPDVNPEAKPEVVMETPKIMTADEAVEGVAHQPQEEAAMSTLDEIKDIASTVGIALLLVLIMRTLLFQPFTIPSASMEPNLYEGDYIIVSKWNYGISNHSIIFSPPIIKERLFDKMPARGDIVVFKLPSDHKFDYIKRVIGLPGDHVQVRDNQLFINDVAVVRKDIKQIEGHISSSSEYGEGMVMTQQETLPNGKVHIMQDAGNVTSGDNTEVFTVPEGYYFVMGDNRDNSLDSRFSPDDLNQPGVGFVPKENLEGKAQIILLSWKPGSSLWKPWTWLNLRWNRFFKPLH